MLIFKLICGILALLPPLFLLQFLLSTGANVPSSDDVRFTELVGKILDGNYPWRNFLQDTFQGNGHFNVVTVLSMAVSAVLGAWDVYPILVCGVLLGCLRVVLLYDAFTYSIKNKYAWLLWPILSALVFLPTQVANYEIDVGVFAFGFNQLGLCLGIWGLVRFRESLLGPAIAGFSIILASMSHGAGVLTGPVFFLGMILLGIKSWKSYLILFLAGLLACFPFLKFFIFEHRLAGNFHPALLLQIKSFIHFIFSALGWPFALTFPLKAAMVKGIFGVALFLICVVALSFKRNGKLLREMACGWMLLSFGFMSVLQIAVFRGQLVGWYTTLFLNFWLGLINFGYVFWSQRPVSSSRKNLLFSLIAVGILSLIFANYISSQLNFAKHSSFLQTRAPVSESCVRNYLVSPTYCEDRLFVWGVGSYQSLMSQLARPLERHALANFASRQQWALQGDFIQNSVRLEEVAKNSKIFWSVDKQIKSVPFFDYRHLNLIMKSPNALEWTVTLPAKLQHAQFVSAVAMADKPASAPDSDGFDPQVWILESGAKPLLVFSKNVQAGASDWFPIGIDLSSWAGKTITLRLTSLPLQSNAGDMVVFRYPHINLSLEPGQARSQAQEKEMLPSNTDLNPDFPKTSSQDWVFDLSDPQAWTFQGMKPLEGSGDDRRRWKVSKASRMLFKRPFNICVADYSHLYFKMSLSPVLGRRVATLRLSFAGFQKILEIPLLPDGQLHAYSYDLKLLELQQGRKLIGMEFSPTPADISENLEAEISELRLLRKEGPSACEK